MAWQFEQELDCPGCGGPRDVWWQYGDPDDKDNRERWRNLEEQAKAEYDHRRCIRCSVRESSDASDAEARREHPSRFYGLHPVFEPSASAGDGLDVVEGEDHGSARPLGDQ